MDSIKYLIDLFLHVDKNLASVIANFGGWSYGILFAVIFMETGLVVTPFLPGDSLLFAAGALSASLGAFNIWSLWGLMVLAAFLGDTVNYWIGHYIGPRAFDPPSHKATEGQGMNLREKLLKREYLLKAQAFYDKHGGKAIVLARFVPIVRTFAPFVAGVGKMNYGKFIMYNAVGGLVWVTIFTLGGYFLGNIPVIKENFHYLVLIIIAVSVVPIVIEVVKAKREKK
ncbi:DedA family protein [Candidatus Shapirobacteria bacterium]|nr:DedA family protein [Candidatus Shapirobacteria bacterium]